MLRSFRPKMAALIKLYCRVRGNLPPGTQCGAGDCADSCCWFITVVNTLGIILPVIITPQLPTPNHILGSLLSYPIGTSTEKNIIAYYLYCINIQIRLHAI